MAAAILEAQQKLRDDGYAHADALRLPQHLATAMRTADVMRQWRCEADVLGQFVAERVVRLITQPPRGPRPQQQRCVPIENGGWEMIDRSSQALAEQLATVERYVHKAEVLIERQRIHVSQCEFNGWDSSKARRVLAEMEKTQKLFIVKRNLLKAEVADLWSDTDEAGHGATAVSKPH